MMNAKKRTEIAIRVDMGLTLQDIDRNDGFLAYRVLRRLPQCAMEVRESNGSFSPKAAVKKHRFRLSPNVRFRP